MNFLFSVIGRKRERNSENLPQTIAATKEFSNLQQQKIELKREEIEIKKRKFEFDKFIRETEFEFDKFMREKEFEINRRKVEALEAIEKALTSNYLKK